jgi:menaquinol-cytochrome c reductase iron-sulfur subunit
MNPKSTGPGAGRRSFFLGVIYGLWGLITAAIAIPASAYLLFPPRAKKSGDWVEAADLSQLKLKQPEEIVFRRNRVDGWKVINEKTSAWLVRMSDKDVVAFAPQCTHLGCAYHWDESTKNFVCPCHTSAFSLEGKVLTGPAPRPLDQFTVKLESNKVLIGRIRKYEG